MMKWGIVVGVVLATVADARAAEHRGRTTCGAYRITVHPARGAQDPGTFEASLCDDAVGATGTATAISSLRFKVGTKSIQLRANIAPPNAAQAREVETLVQKVDELRQAAQALQGVPDPTLLDKVFRTDATFEEGVRTNQSGSAVACSNPVAIAATAGVAAFINREPSIQYRDYWIPSHCTVITSGKVDVTNLRVDGMLIRVGGEIKAGTLSGNPPGGIGLGTIVVAGPLATPRRTISQHVEVGPPDVVANAIDLAGVDVYVTGSVDAQRIELATGALLDAGEAVRSTTVVVAGGRLEAKSVELATLAVRAKGSVSTDEYLGSPRAGGASATATVDDGGVVTKGRMTVAALVVKNGGGVRTAELECPAIDATGGSLVRASTRLTGRRIDLVDSRLSGGEATTVDVVAKASSINLATLDAARVTGMDAGVRIRRRMTVRTAPATIELARGALVVSTQALDPDDPATPPGTPEPDEPAGDPAFDKCLATPPGLDATVLAFDGTDVSIRHSKLTTLRGKGGTYRPVRHPGVRGVPRATMCLEVADSAQLDGTYVAASRLYAALGSGKLVGKTELAADEGGDLPRTGSRRIHNEDHPDGTGASFGGYGGTHGNLGGADFLPALAPIDEPRTFRQGGLGGLGGDASAVANGHATGFPGAGVIEIVARELVLDGTMHADARTFPDGTEGAGGGSGGSIVIAVSGNLAGKGSITANGGDGGFARTRGGTGGGGSGGRIRIEHASLNGWRGVVHAFGGLGGRITKQALAEPRSVPPWVDWRNHGGPGTIYWKRADGNGRIVIEGPPLAAGVHRGVGFITGDFPGEEVVVKNAFVVTKGIKARSLTLTDHGVLAGDDPRMRLEWVPTDLYFSAGPHDKKKGTNPISQVDFPNELWQEPLEEKIAIELSGDLTIDRTSRVDLTGAGGYSQLATLGGGTHTNRAGGSHGGIGGLGMYTARHSIGRPNDSTGSWAEPTTIGEGGWGDNAFDKKRHLIGSLGGAGGGAVRVTVAGTATIDGRLAADGAPGAPFIDSYDDFGGTGGGAGGSVWLTTGALAGKGTISAAGGNGTASPKSGAYGGGGGGGRVRVDVANERAWRGRVHAYGGAGGKTDAKTPKGPAATPWKFATPWQDVRYDGGPGTVYWVVRDDAGRLVVDGRGGGKGLGRLGGNLVERASTVELVGARVLADDLTADRLVIKTGSVLAPNDPRVQRLYLDGFTHPFDVVTLPAKPAKTSLSIAARALELDRTSRIDATGLGGYGAHACIKSCMFTNRAGGSHGGTGGTGVGSNPPDLGEPSATTGDALQPATPGQGGWGAKEAAAHELGYQPCAMGAAGGGALKIDVAETFALAGTVRANGASAPARARCEQEHDTGGGGAGGSIWIKAATIKGAGTLAANGGNGSRSKTGNGGGGGGGRIAIEGACRSGGKRTVVGGTGDGGAFAGGKGTIKICGR
jgi:hypothetical protein